MKKAALLAILIVAAALRLWKLGSIPPGLTPDEASLGYNAYSILRTGRDEYGKLFPIIFKSFGDYKPGLYVYLTVPFVALFGLSEFAIRLPGALAGVMAVGLIYLVVDLLFKKGPTRNGEKVGTDTMALIASLLLAISPWHIHFSRGAWEVNVALTLTLAGIYCFLRALRNGKFLYLSSVFFALTFLTYQGAKLSTSIAIFALLIVYWGKARKWLVSVKPRLIGSIVIGVVISLPVLLSLFQGRVGRLEVFSVFSYPRPKEYLEAFLDQGGEKVGDVNYFLFHSEPLNFARGIMGRWFNHFSGRFLFFEGDWQNPRHTAPNHGVLLLSDVILLASGFIGLVCCRRGRNVAFFLLWLVVAPLPAVLSRDQVQAVRALNLVIPLTVVSSLGLELLWKKFPRIRFAFLGIIAIAFVYFVDAYFIHLPKHDAKLWFYGYKQVIEQVTPVQHDYQKIIFQQSYNQPYIYFLFYQKYDPVGYQKQANLIEGGIDVGLVGKLDNISFERFSWPAPARKGELVVGDDVSTLGSTNDPGYNLISEIKYPNDMIAFRILEKL
jgi:4-amino-4-deoxy-L-arabinose transferase-like glycosyltransferase